MPNPSTRLPRSVRLLIAARAVNRLGAFSLSFLTVLISSEFGTGPATAGLVSAGFGLATIPSRLIGGNLADRLGRRRTIVLGLTGCAIAQSGLAVSGTLPMAVGFAVLLGLVFELYEPPSQAMIADTIGPPGRVRAYSLMNAALALAGMGAGLLAAGLGRWDLRWLFVVDAATCLACAIVVRIVLPRDSPGSDGGSGPVGHSPWRDRALVLMTCVGTLFALIYLQIVALLPLSLAERGLDPADAGLLFTASAMTICVGQPLLRGRAGALPRAAAMAIGQLLLAFGLFGYAMAHDLPALLVSTVVWSLGDLFLLGRAYAIVAGLAPDGSTGRYLAAYGISWGIAGVAGPLTGTQILQHMGSSTLWAGLGVLALLLAVAQYAFVEPCLARRRPASGTRAWRRRAATVWAVRRARGRLGKRAA